MQWRSVLSEIRFRRSRINHTQQFGKNEASMKRSLAIASLFAMAVSTVAAPITVELYNPTDEDWAEVPVAVPMAKGQGILQTAKSAEGAAAFIQCDDLDGDGTPDEAFFLAKIPAITTVTYELTEDKFPTTPPARTHTGMYMPTPTMKGMEGPGWESDLIAFRLYWDARNATDVFCKTESILSLDKFAAKGHDYHRQSKWGQDVLKVGTAVGIGGFGVLDNGAVCKVADAKRVFKERANGPLRS